MKTSAKIIKLHTAKINDWVIGCKKQDPQAQAELYEEYAPQFMAICMRYLRQREDAEDVLMEAFVQIFNKISHFKFQGSFEGWMKRITINQCLMHLRKKKMTFSELDHQAEKVSYQESPLDEIYEKEILALLAQLPDGYRTVFNLYVIEGYKHREIANMLNISINTSKSQLILARKKLASFIEKDQKDGRSKG